MKTVLHRFAFICGVIIAGLSVTAAEKPPNIVVIFIDDMGYADIGPFGGKPELTPNLNRMAAEGRRFSNFYVSQAVC